MYRYVIITEPVDNPGTIDRREKYDWRKLKQIKPGIYRIIPRVPTTIDKDGKVEDFGCAAYITPITFSGSNVTDHIHPAIFKLLTDAPDAPPSASIVEDEMGLIGTTFRNVLADRLFAHDPDLFRKLAEEIDADWSEGKG